MNNTAIHRIDAINRALIGFDTMFDQMERRYGNSVNNNYPPHNILKTGDNQYEIQIAVTGFEKSEITVSVESNVLQLLAKEKNLFAMKIRRLFTYTEDWLLEILSKNFRWQNTSR